MRPRSGGPAKLLSSGALCALLLAALSAACGGGAPKNRPNFLVIITDDQRYGTVAEYMPETQKRLFDEGVTFDNAFVTTPLCCPSRASILTGMYGHNTGVHNNPDPLDKMTFVQRLKDDGYYTGLVGKYLNSWDFNKPRPEFNYWVANAPGGTEYYNPRVNENGARKRFKLYITGILQQYAITFIDEAAKRNEPFSLIFAPNAPHEPAIPRIDDVGLYPDLQPYRPANYNEEDVSDKPQWLQNMATLTPAHQQRIDALRRRQLQSLKEVDRTIAALLDELKTTGELDDTVIFFISDNGLFWGEHRLDGKVYPYEPAIHVPMAIRYPKLAPAGRHEEALAANIDIAPTIYELAGISKPREVDGISLVPLLQGKGTERKDIIIEAWPGRGHYAAVRTDRYIYIETDGDSPELYDLQLDPDELTNIAADPSYFDTMDELRTRLHDLVGEAPPTPTATGASP